MAKQVPSQAGFKQAQDLGTKEKTTNNNENKDKFASSGGQDGQPGCSKKENNNGFTPLPKTKSFKQKKNFATTAVTNFYSLLNKPDFSNKDEELLDTIQEIQLDKNRLVVELEKMDESVGGDLFLHEVDDTPINVGKCEELDLTPNKELDTEMESLKQLKRVHNQVGSPPEGSQSRVGKEDTRNNSPNSIYENHIL